MADDYTKSLAKRQKTREKITDDMIKNLFRQPKKDKGKNMPKFSANEKDAVHQADLLFMPHDNEYKYILVVVDVYSRLTGAEPLKDKQAKTILKGFQTIYNRDDLDMPQRLEVDSGSEFKGEVAKFFRDNGVFVRVAKPRRHRQQGLVESRNKLISKPLLQRQVAQELLTGKSDSQWVEDLPGIIEAVNEEYEQDPGLVTQKVGQPPLIGDDEILDIGTKVRVQLDEPIDVATKRPLKNGFRSGDIRWHPQIRVIKHIVLRPNTPVMYLLDGNSGAMGVEPIGYTRNQLQVLNPQEKAPPKKVLRGDVDKWAIKEIIDKRKKNGKIEYKVVWMLDNEVTWEPRSTLIKDVPDLIKLFDATQ